MSYTCCDCPYAGRAERVATRKAQLDGYEVFIASRDGNHFVRTQDFRTDRINFAIVDGFVRSAEVG